MLSTVTISSPDGETEAEFAPEANLVCCSLRVRGEELLDHGHGLEAYAERGKTMGIPLLHPWANRLSGRGYTVAGHTVSLPEPDGRYALDPNGLPIHGALPGLLRWSVEADSPTDRLAATLAWRSDELLELFPFEHELTMDVRVGPGELTIETVLHATGEQAVPVSFGFHPYLRLPGSSRRDWRVTLGATQRLVLDERMIPTGAREPLAVRSFVLGDASWDDGLNGLDDPPRFAVASDRLTATMTFERGFAYGQVYAPEGHDFICFEPMTAPTDALRTGRGLRAVAPGASFSAEFSLAVV